MSWKTTGIVLAALWVAALVWLVTSLGDGDDTRDPGVVQQTEAAEVDAGPAQEPGATEPEPEVSGADVAPREVAPVETTEPTTEPTPDELVPEPSTQQSESTPGEAPEAEPREPDAFQRKVLEKIFDPLAEAGERYERQEGLPKKRLIGEDQRSNQKAIDKLMDQAVEVLEISELTDVRQRLRAIDESIETRRKEIAGHREARLAAPPEDELSALEKAVRTSREDLDAKIEDAESAIAEAERERIMLEQEFVQGLRDIGLEVDLETAKHLLGTVSGDDFLDLCVVFDNVKLVTEQLRVLTEQSGESLDLARRYYGSYVVLIRILDEIQKDFVRRVREEQVPRLGEFAAQARENIARAEANQRAGGDPQIAEQNIRSNRLTEQACEYYTRYLMEQAADVEAQNEELQVRLRDAENTYDTVQLSSQVAELLREGQRNFSALLELEVPKLRGFENSELQAEFEKLTRQLVEP